MTQTAPAPRSPWRALRAIRHARRSLAGKLMVVMLVTTFIALAAAGAALIFTDLRDSRANWADDMRTEAGIVAFAVQPALSFNDHDRAERNLSSLQARESISAAALYTPDGTLFAQYVRQGHLPPPARQLGNLEFDRPFIDGERVLLLRPVIQNGETLGTIYLRAEYDIGERVRAYLNILGAVMIIGLLAALFASSWLQTRSGPSGWKALSDLMKEFKG